MEEKISISPESQRSPQKLIVKESNKKLQK